MYPSLPDSCFLSPPAEITADLAATFANKMNLFIKAQLLGKSIADAEAAFSLLMELAADLVPNDSAFLFWRSETDESFLLEQTRGFNGVAPAHLLLDIIAANGKPGMPSPLILCSDSPISQHYQQALADLSADSLLSMPLYLGEGVAGVLMLARRKAPCFNPDEAHLLRVFCLTFEGILEDLTSSQEARRMTFQDALTGLFSRRYFEQQIEREMDRARRTNEQTSMFLLNIDGFSLLKDRFGYAAADALLRETARALSRVCRKSDTLARFHDDHFGIIMPRTGKENLSKAANRIFEALDGVSIASSADSAAELVEFNLSAAAYPQDASSAESALSLCFDGLSKASRRIDGPRFYHPPLPTAKDAKGELLDMSRVSLFREPLHDNTRILQLFARLCLDSVPADRVSIVVPVGNEFVVQAAYGFDGVPETASIVRMPKDSECVSAYVSQRREPLLVSSSSDVQGAPLNNGPAYTSTSFFSYPLIHENDLLGIINFSEHSEGKFFIREDVENFAPMAKLISQYLAMDVLFGTARKEFLRDSLFALVDFMENQVEGMSGHSREVARLAEAAARQLGYSDDQAEVVWLSSMLHDLGKVSFRGRVLSEPRPLSSQERALTQRHPLLGWKFLEEIPLPNLDREAILMHHEREDGSGYLRKSSDAVPHAAKVLAVADVFQALCSPRPYRPALSQEEALQYLDENKGTLFDGAVVDALKAVV